MASLIEIVTGRLGYRDVVQHVLRSSRIRSPRGLRTYDAGWVTVVINDPTDTLPLGCGRNLSRAVAAAESLQLIGGFSTPTLLTRASSRFAEYLEPDGYFHGAYGVRVGGQVAQVISKIRTDRDTRQAVITLWDPRLDNLPGRRDYPCTVALRFSVVDDLLELDVVMRSNDVILGVPYDWFQFTQLQQTVARVLDVAPGPYRHTAWSLHVYERDLDAAHRVTHPTVESERQPHGIGGGADHEWSAVQLRALRLSTGRLPAEDRTRSEDWYAGAVAGVRGA